MKRAADTDGGGSLCAAERFVVRLENGELSPQMLEARRAMGLPPPRV
jgi:hypothetical protein